MRLGPEKYRLDPGHMRTLKRWVWAYFLLLIFEGALRKWFLPSLSDALLIVRDPVGIWLIAFAWYRKVFAPNLYIATMWFIAAVSFVATLLAGHGNMPVAVYGLRPLVIYFPLIFLIGRILDRRDVLQIGRVVLLLSIPMTVLIAVQFYSPQSAWVNRGLAGDLTGAGFGGADGFMRPPGTFSFITGVFCFYGLAAACVWYFWFNIRLVKRWLLVAASICVICAVPLSISRTLFFHVLLSTLFALVYSALRPRNLLRMAMVLCALGVVYAALSGVPFFETATETMTSRFIDANDSEGGSAGSAVKHRFFDAFTRGIEAAWQAPAWGEGIGLGTNVGAKIVSGNRAFLVAEEEWSRVVGEQGMLLGLSTLLLRVLVTLQMLVMAVRRMSRSDALPWMLCSFAVAAIPSGAWAQPTVLGFAVLVGGLVFALNNRPEGRMGGQWNG